MMFREVQVDVDIENRKKKTKAGIVEAEQAKQFAFKSNKLMHVCLSK